MGGDQGVTGNNGSARPVPATPSPAVETITTTVYRFECDGCGLVSGLLPDEETAGLSARAHANECVQARKGKKANG